MKLNTCYFVLHSGSVAASALLFCSLACYIFEKCYIALYWAEKKKKIYVWRACNTAFIFINGKNHRYCALLYVSFSLFVTFL